MHRYLALGLMAGVIGATACGDTDTYDMTDTSAGALGDSLNLGVPDLRGDLRDADVVSGMHMSNSAEIELGELAVQRATHADVKAFAEMMVADHRQMNQSLSSLVQQFASTESEDRAEDVADDSKDWVEDLREKTGREFDERYMEIMVESHEDALDLLNRAANSNTSAEVQSAVNTARPKVQAHLDRARQIRESLNNTAE